MKKLGLLIAIIAIVTLAGCATGGGGGGGSGAAPFIVDLSTLSPLRNESAFTKAWDDHLILLPASSLPSDFSQYTRFTVTADYFDAAGNQIPHGDSNVMVTMIYDVNGDIRGPANGPGPNTPVKEFNVGGFSGLVSGDRGIRITFARPPQAVLFQNNAGSQVAFVEIKSMVFHNGNYKSE